MEERPRKRERTERGLDTGGRGWWLSAGKTNLKKKRRRFCPCERDAAAGGEGLLLAGVKASGNYRLGLKHDNDKGTALRAMWEALRAGPKRGNAEWGGERRGDNLRLRKRACSSFPGSYH